MDFEYPAFLMKKCTCVEWGGGPYMQEYVDPANCLVHDPRVGKPQPLWPDLRLYYG